MTISSCSDHPVGTFDRMGVRTVLWWIVLAMVGLPALSLTIVRALQPEAAVWVQWVAFTPWALVGYTAGLVMAATLVWRRRSRWGGALAVVAAAGLVLHGAWFAPLLTDESRTAPARGESLTVMTANLLYGSADGAGVVRAAVEEDVDVLVVEEVTAGLLAEMEAAGLEDSWPHRAGVPRPSAQGTMVFSDVPLGPEERVDTTWDSWLVDVGDVSLLAVHPVSPLELPDWRADHELLRSVVAAERPDLVVGDFNATLDHRFMRDLADDGWRSVTEVTGGGWQPTWSPSALLGDVTLPIPALVQIDHVLAGPSVVSVGSHTVDVPGSDHRALVAQVVVTR